MNRREFGQSVASMAAFAQTGNRGGGAPAGSLTDVPGLRVGHFTDSRRPTGCTAILFDAAYAAGVDYNGSAPGESQVVRLTHDSDACVDPLAMFTGDQRATVALGFLSLLAGVAAKS